MLRVGLTGPAGAGKSTVAEGLARVGIPVIDADGVAHQLYQPGSELVSRLVEAFGESVRDVQGGIDRGVLGSIVFRDDASRARLNAIVHPPLLAELRRRLGALEAAGERVAVLEAALLLQWGPPAYIDVVVAVVAPRDIRLARLIDKGMDAEAANRRLDAQVDDESLLASAQYVVDNHGDEEHLKMQVEGLSVELWRRADRR